MTGFFTGMVAAIRLWLAAPGRQAMALAGMGILGLAFAGAGYALWEARGDGDSGTLQASADGTATATATATRRVETSVSTRTPSATAAVTTTATASATTSPSTSTGGGGGTGGGGSQVSAPVSTTEIEEPTAVPTAVPPTEVPVVRSSCTSEPGLFPPMTMGGWAYNAEEGSVVTVLFDGVPVLSAVVSQEGYRVDFNLGGNSCLNRAGATVGVVHEGVSYGSEQTIPAGGAPALIRLDFTAPAPTE
ncbi:MAG: hypothetical protein ACSLFM_10390 [Tepidiformaceae bacterium]